MKKHRARSKSWLCFQAKSADDRHESGFNGYVKEKDKNLMHIPSVSSENSLSKVSSKSSTRSRRRSTSRRTLSRIIKAVFFEASLKKSQKVGQDPFQGLRNIPTIENQKEKEVEESMSMRSRITKDSGAASNSSHSSASSISCSSISCSSSSSSSNLSNLSEQRKSFQSCSLEFQESTHKKRIKNPYSAINGLCLLVIALMVLVLWGRICAIVCTSTWIYYGSLGTRRPHREYEDEEDEVMVVNSKRREEEEMESKEYKKRVIMGGLLERKHSRI